MPSPTLVRVRCVRRIGKRTGTRCAPLTRIASANASSFEQASTYDACSASCWRTKTASVQSFSVPFARIASNAESICSCSRFPMCISENGIGPDLRRFGAMASVIATTGRSKVQRFASPTGWNRSTRRATRTGKVGNASPVRGKLSAGSSASQCHYGAVTMQLQFYNTHVRECGTRLPLCTGPCDRPKTCKRGTVPPRFTQMPFL